MFSVAWQYLNGRSVASTPDRLAAEWPPHPDRVFQALVAAWGETGESPDERAALEWIERQPPPELAAPEADPRDAHTAFVPVNDVEGSRRAREYGDPMRSLLPSVRGRKERQFHSAHVGDAVCALIWPEAVPEPAVASALESLCAKVTHLGHSSSLVRMWIESDPPMSTLIPSDAGSPAFLRVPHSGRLDALITAYSRGEEGWQRPPMALSAAYGPRALADEAVTGDFGVDWVVLRTVRGHPFGLGQAPALVAALRATLMKAADANPAALALISGHDPDTGGRMERPHLAIVPLGDVGHAHADGHVLGMAMVFPRGVPFETRDACLAAWVAAGDESGRVDLVFGAAGVLSLADETRERRPRALRVEIWCRPSTHWASVTPLALDRLPPRRTKDPDAWAANQIAGACERIGLPRPVGVRLLPVSRFEGAPACRGFPPLRRREDGGPRRHVHASLAFDRPVAGPVLLGAGRYRGYGICRPFASGQEEEVQA